MQNKQIEEFEARGVVKLDGLIPRELVDHAAQRAVDVLERAGVMRDGDWIAGRVAGWTVRNSLSKRLKPLARERFFGDLVSTDVLAAASKLAGDAALGTMIDRPQILFTPPDAETWTVPHKIWHLDYPRLGELGRPGVQMFAVLRSLRPGGGGTLVVAGSHRLLNDRGHVASKNVKKALKREPWFGALLKGDQPDRDRFLREPGRVGDVPVQVVEMHGEPGDVYMVDLRVLHTLAPNAAESPRLMLTQRFVRTSLLEELGAGADDGGGEAPAQG